MSQNRPNKLGTPHCLGLLDKLLSSIDILPGTSAKSKAWLELRVKESNVNTA